MIELKKTSYKYTKIKAKKKRKLDWFLEWVIAITEIRNWQNRRNKNMMLQKIIRWLSVKIRKVTKIKKIPYSYDDFKIGTECIDRICKLIATVDEFIR